MFLPPNFLAVHTSHDEYDSELSESVVGFYRLDRDAVFHLASFKLPKPTNYLNHEVACGAKLIPGEAGLCVISGTEDVVSIMRFTER